MREKTKDYRESYAEEAVAHLVLHSYHDSNFSLEKPETDSE